MRDLNKQEIQVIARVVKRRQPLVSKNTDIWAFVHNEFNIGTPEGDKYRLSREDFSNLRTCVESISGIDPLKYDEQSATKDRIIAARSLVREKHAKQSPTYHRINITAHCGQITLKTGECKLPLGSTLDIRYDNIPTPDAVIICENLEVFNQWHLVNLPESLRRTITCYRGHDVQSTHLNNWLNEIKNDCNIILFPDLDPSGIKNALSPRYPKHSLLVPTTTSFNHSPYHRELFAKQAKDMATLNQLQSVSTDVINLINQLNTVQAAYIQELMVANQQELTLINV